MSKTTVRQALEQVINAWASVQTPPVGIAWENVSFKPSTDAPWLQVTLIPAETVSGSLCAAEHKGLLHINVFSPSGFGAGPAEQMAESIAALFPAGFRTNGVRITRPPTVGAGIDDPGGWHMVPVRARYQLN